MYTAVQRDPTGTGGPCLLLVYCFRGELLDQLGALTLAMTDCFTEAPLACEHLKGTIGIWGTLSASWGLAVALALPLSLPSLEEGHELFIALIWGPIPRCTRKVC